MTSWTRATTVANTLADRYGLERWAQRNTVLGLGAREDLYALAASCTPDDKDELNRIVDQAQEAAKARSGANLGTALHRLTERIDSGELDPSDVPTQWQPDVAAYQKALADGQVTIHREYIERIVILPDLKIAGTLDRIVTVDGQLTVADLKTGANAVDYPHDMTIQLALYANAGYMWKGTAEDVDRDRWGRYVLPDPEKEPDVYEPMPAVDQTTALVIHLPVDQGSCSLHQVDLAAGWEAAQQAVWVREWRKRKNLTNPYTQRRLTLVADADDDW
jgi:hypothetical protein